MSQQQIHFSSQIHAAFDWWRDAGVDIDFTDDVTDWLEKQAGLAPVKSEQVAAKPPESDLVDLPQKKIDLLGENPSQDLKEFREWWLSDPAIDQIGIRGRIPPIGPRAAQLMIVVMTPEEEDTQSLLSGAQGKLLDGFLRAARLERSEIYIASVLPRHSPISDGNNLKSTGYGKVLLHHIRLAEPKRLLVLGKNILPLLGHEMTQEPAHLQNINHENHTLPLMVVEGLGSMLAMPRLKARFWRKWLDWMDG